MWHLLSAWENSTFFFLFPPLCYYSCGVFKECQSFAATGPRANTFWQQADEWTEPRGVPGSWRLEVRGLRGRSGSEINVLWLASKSINQSRGEQQRVAGRDWSVLFGLAPYGFAPASSVSVTGSFIYSSNQHSTVVVGPSTTRPNPYTQQLKDFTSCLPPTLTV